MHCMLVNVEIAISVRQANDMPVGVLVAIVVLVVVVVHMVLFCTVRIDQKQTLCKSCYATYVTKLPSYL